VSIQTGHLSASCQVHLRHVQVSTSLETLWTVPPPQPVSSISLPGPANRLMVNSTALYTQAQPKHKKGCLALCHPLQAGQSPPTHRTIMSSRCLKNHSAALDALSGTTHNLLHPTMNSNQTQTKAQLAVSWPPDKSRPIKAGRPPNTPHNIKHRSEKDSAALEVM
jgi:hypothetical protein